MSMALKQPPSSGDNGELNKEPKLRVLLQLPLGHDVKSSSRIKQKKSKYKTSRRSWSTYHLTWNRAISQKWHVSFHWRWTWWNICSWSSCQLTRCHGDSCLCSQQLSGRTSVNSAAVFSRLPAVLLYDEVYLTATSIKLQGERVMM